MASSRWSSLPSDILSTISKIISTDVDTLRLRSVCSSWRSSVPPRLKPSPFPLKVPLLSNCDTHSYSSGGDYYLKYTTIYRVSPPEYGPCAGDTSDGWLFRVIELSPNRFGFLSLTVPIGDKYAPGCMPESLNLLHYRITEISKCYCLTFVDSKGFVTDILDPQVLRVSVLSNDCDFAVFALFTDGYAMCWKFGQKDWILLGQGFDDMVVFDGKCYAIDDKGVLFYFDSNLKPVEAHVAPLPGRLLETRNDLLVYKSDLYVISSAHGEVNIDFEDENKLLKVPDIQFRLEILKKCKNSWEYVGCLPNEAIVYCEHASIVLQVDDFRSLQGNCVHLTIRSSRTCSRYGESVTYYGVYHFAGPETAILKQVIGIQLMLWRPPGWLLSD